MQPIWLGRGGQIIPIESRSNLIIKNAKCTHCLRLKLEAWSKERYLNTPIKNAKILTLYGQADGSPLP
ncbi:MAG: hypothetical protein BRC39_12245 [Cyanobacteria bacterium QH_7_48_89]|nr:MAG: hypothetical protein BRC39_12245 [Cyanobacteria bacterium QH_7_48_89]